MTVNATEPESPLNGTSWKLKNLYDGQTLVPVIEGTEITAIFEAANVNGTAGCNGYSAPYQTDGNEISFGPWTGTQIACDQPEGIMDQEHAYLSLLGRAKTYAVSSSEPAQLGISDQNGQVILEYEAVPIAVPFNE